ncbi:DNA-(apurinic or apyrimidinic site) lyase / Formamidopyrimidine-DNA glycosylase [Magnetococcus marinus MC-1]|uniref:Formamidopyrimidine-DNA glycosylase n=1 Tax=Magnetococcus marinus (strain ATCC BAA-1437 / JCM 17883 / MC-1) TaxID=156889 RepID=FPG_MAGMM|nr:bifunctional DNA-formamidopyrimidine glycosylase/DNA-(apurinic or apyrimidinic site) lyase [Magnetococcus marinus]A0L837.1 RecName: Full=Formamidopyrimidine-DNA glycosylase; Short=Fapy-DNA glycosylase; AltName: Full=DNA-(apurinic or apyrimidinic site) lyase MutM; Short=AP lyase MutM [Magnetococcus marinus MC-1]ABK44130.1 DNA-(apurinic or apyrimidinic site) lyase / Formamidopyrimidine-DNA glycosylase [Magnetococcus marinus MC-1]
MPELPEVETTRRGIEPALVGKRLCGVVVRQPQLRWPIPVKTLEKELVGQVIQQVARRAKYLLWRCPQGTLLVHLGMSGSLRIVPEHTPPAKHDHVDWVMEGGQMVRLHDPRRFGAVVWIPVTSPEEEHPLLAKLGPEPLHRSLNGRYLHQGSRGRQLAVKNYIMDQSVVVGVGNIYASEALFRAGIAPAQAAGKVGLGRYRALACAIKAVLGDSIEQGGTTLRDFIGSDGKPGYFVQSLNVYGRAGKACPKCGTTIEKQVLGQRSSYYCPQCQRA